MGRADYFKHCSRCKQPKTMEDFGRKAAAADGCRSECKECQASYFRHYAETNKVSLSQKDKERYWKDPEAARARYQTWLSRNKVQVLARRRKVYQERIQEFRAKGRVWNATNVEFLREKSKTFKVNNRALFCFYQNKRRGALKQATPFWANQEYMKAAYKVSEMLTRSTGFAWAVDHIVPLTSKTVCGLNVPANLQVITRAENSKKSNSYWPDMPNGT